MQIYTEFSFVSTVFSPLDKRTKNFGSLMNISIFLKELQHLPTFMR